jgi:hypothetical protein
MRSTLRMTRLGAILAACLAAGGCAGSHRVQGRVIEGPRSMVLVVDQNDPRLNQPGIPGVAIDLMIDPQSLNRKPGGSEVSMADGSFAVPVQEFGAGVLEYQLGVVAVRNGFAPTETTAAMPAFHQRLLILMVKGQNNYRKPEDPLDAIRQLNP